MSLLEWLITAATTAVLLFDVVLMARRSGEPTMRRCAIALSGYLALAVCFGIWTGYFHGQQFAGEFFAGWLTEYSLSVDTLFIFVIIMTSFNVPRAYDLPFINGGKHIDVPEIPTSVSLAVIAATLVVAAAASLYKTRAGGTEQPQQV